MIYNSGTFEGNEKTWFLGDSDNILYSISQNGMTSIETIIPLDKTVSNPYRANAHCVVVEDNVYVLPDKSKTIYKYNTKTKKIVGAQIGLDSSRYSIYWGCVIDDKLWCMTFNTGELIAINPENLVIEDIFFVSSRKEKSFRGEAIAIGEKIYIVERNFPYVIEFDTKKKAMVKHEILCGEDGFGTIQFDRKMFYLTGYEKNIYVWDYKSGDIITVPLNEMQFPIEKDDKCTTRFYSSKIIGEYLVVFPQNNMTYSSNYIAALNIVNHNVHYYNLQGAEKDVYRKLDEELVYNYSVGNKIYVQDHRETKYWVVDLISKKVIQEEMHLDREKIISFWKQHIESGNTFGVVNEDYLDLEMFLKVLV